MARKRRGWGGEPPADDEEATRRIVAAMHATGVRRLVVLATVSVPDPRDLNPAVPDAVAQVLLALLAKKPEDRPESGEALAHLWALARREVWTAHARGQYRGGRTRTRRRNGEVVDG